jgi:hypothetical protein
MAPMKRLLVISLLALSAASAAAKEVVPFIENDFAKAVARAKAKSEPIFVDAWAPW